MRDIKNLYRYRVCSLIFLRNLDIPTWHHNYNRYNFSIHQIIFKNTQPTFRTRSWRRYLGARLYRWMTPYWVALETATRREERGNYCCYYLKPTMIPHYLLVVRCDPRTTGEGQCSYLPCLQDDAAVVDDCVGGDVDGCVCRDFALLVARYWVPSYSVAAWVRLPPRCRCLRGILFWRSVWCQNRHLHHRQDACSYLLPVTTGKWRLECIEEHVCQLLNIHANAKYSTTSLTFGILMIRKVQEYQNFQ